MLPHTTACVLKLLMLVCMCLHTTIHATSGAAGGGLGGYAAYVFRLYAALKAAWHMLKQHTCADVC